MENQERIINADIIESDNERIFVDVNALIETLKNMDEAKSIETKDGQERLEFKKAVFKLMQECTLKGPRPWQNPNCIVGEAPGFDLCYDKEEIEKHKEEIYNLLMKIRDVTRFNDLKTLKSGEEWTILRQQISILMSLGNAAGFIDFKKSAIERINDDDSNPEISIRK